jgi:hypothetical protein
MKKFLCFYVLCAGCSLLRAGGFFVTLKVLGINIMQFFVTRNLDLGLAFGFTVEPGFDQDSNQ